MIETHPLQTRSLPHKPARLPVAVTKRAYEVYCALFGKQEAMMTGNCRGGFGANELIAFLYARSFPSSEWEERVKEALTGMEGI